MRAATRRAIPLITRQLQQVLGGDADEADNGHCAQPNDWLGVPARVGRRRAAAAWPDSIASNRVAHNPTTCSRHPDRGATAPLPHPVQATVGPAVRRNLGLANAHHEPRAFTELQMPCVSGRLTPELSCGVDHIRVTPKASQFNKPPVSFSVR